MTETKTSSAPRPDLSRSIGRVAAPLREQVLDALREAILDSTYKPGQRLIERELIEQTGVSRTTVREALRELEAEGLVTTIPQKGAVVVVLSREEATNLYEVREALESLAVRQFVSRADQTDIEKLSEAYQAFARIVEQNNHPIRDVLRAKDNIYQVLINGARNQAIGSILSTLQARVSLLRAASLTQPGRAQEAVREMQTLVDAIEIRDADAAVAATALHLENAARHGVGTLLSS